mmetsp:Transcript_95938/g.219920  ORF Transcript_95938/g.219920 Transcript_95938/m.219920 type:complete len:279 (-) Transcript_95938:805-1641(-)
MQQSVSGHWPSKKLLEIVLRLPQCPGHERQQPLRQSVHVLLVLLHGLLEPRHQLLRRRPLHGTEQGTQEAVFIWLGLPGPGHAVEIEALLVVLALSVAHVRGGQQQPLAVFVPSTKIPSDRTLLSDTEGVLLGLVQGEQGLLACPHPVNHLGGDPVVHHPEKSASSARSVDLTHNLRIVLSEADKWNLLEILGLHNLGPQSGRQAFGNIRVHHTEGLRGHALVPQHHHRVVVIADLRQLHPHRFGQLLVNFDDHIRGFVQTGDAVEKVHLDHVGSRVS